MGLFSKMLKKEIKPNEKTQNNTNNNSSQKKIKAIIACGSGIATSTMARTKLEKGFEKRNIPIEIYQCKIGELEGMAKTHKPNFVIHTVVLPEGLHFDCPTFSGVPFLTGVGLSKLFDDIIDSLTK